MRALQPFLDTFLAYMKEHSFEQTPRELYAPVDYILHLGGKRMRPVMALMSYYLFQSNYERALPAAYAIEIFHNFSLVHDDIMDEAPLRRGKTTIHQKWDVNTAILSGDVMLIYAYKYLLQLDTENELPAILKTFNQAAVEVCEGQQYDINFEERSDVTIEEYLKMIELKTAVLLAGGMKIGALLGGATPEEAEHVYEFGKHVGIAFQLQDDYLDTFGDPKKFGKKVGGDIVQNKKTYLILKALELADSTTKAELEGYMNTPTSNESEKITAVKQILVGLDIPKYAANLKEQYQRKAFEHINALSVAKERRQPLVDMADLLLLRTY